MLTRRRAPRRTQAQQQRVDHAVDETQHGGHKQTGVLVQAIQTLLRRHLSQPRLQGENEEQCGRHGAHEARVILVRLDAHCNERAETVGQ